MALRYINLSITLGHIDTPIDTSGVDERALMREIYFKLIPWLCCLCLLSFLYRSAIGNAKLYGPQKDLHLTSNTTCA
jgi:hypothetical protein